MEILKTNIDSKVEVLKATRNSSSMKDLADGTTLDFNNYVLYNQTSLSRKDENGEQHEIESTVLSIKCTETGAYVSTNSITFIKEFNELMPLIEEVIQAGESCRMVKSSGKTGKGTFVKPVIE